MAGRLVLSSQDGELTRLSPWLGGPRTAGAGSAGLSGQVDLIRWGSEGVGLVGPRGGVVRGFSWVAGPSASLSVSP